ncbi:hypothetical protein QQF64_031776 [Cirrhinus molitorella]|uniref:Ig-like domain-containing protein n=1 Tax=Cirrhinus molitorella TaxID=172907 RepID=A0ABR3MY04_9TELE
MTLVDDTLIKDNEKKRKLGEGSQSSVKMKKLPLHESSQSLDSDVAVESDEGVNIDRCADREEEAGTGPCIICGALRTLRSERIGQIDAPQTSVYPKDNVHLGIQNTLICHVTGFYPPALSISWAKNNVNATEGMSLSQYHPRTDGTFTIFSTLKFTPSEGDIYSCTVNHGALQGQPQTKIWDVDVALPSVGPTVFCGVGVILGLVGVAVGTFFLIKGNK